MVCSGILKKNLPFGGLTYKLKKLSNLIYGSSNLRATVLIASLIVVLTFAAALPRGAAADFYKFVDKDGRVHYTDVPKSDKFKWVMKERGSKGIPYTYSFSSIDSLVRMHSKKWNLDPALVKAVIRAESNFKSRAVSSAGAKGLMQLMPATAKQLGVENVYDPSENIGGGVRYLNQMLKKFDGDERLALAAYNAGVDAVLKYGGVPPYKETRIYVSRVLKFRKAYLASAR